MAGPQGGLPGSQGSSAALVAVLIGLNAAGCYGFLARAHIASSIAGEIAVAGRAAHIEARIAVQAGVVADLDRRRTVEADLGPVKYLATLIGADNETVLRWFILAVRAVARSGGGLAVTGRGVGEASIGPQASTLDRADTGRVFHAQGFCSHVSSCCSPLFSDGFAVNLQ